MSEQPNERERQDLLGLLSWTWAAGLGAGAIAGALTRSWGVAAWVGGMAVYAPVAYGAACKVLDNLAGRTFVKRLAELDRERHELENERLRLQTALQDHGAVYPDANGRYPLIRNTEGKWLDPNSLTQFTIDRILAMEPWTAAIDARIRALVAAHSWPTPATAQAMIPDQAAGGTLGASTLGELLAKYHHTPRLHGILIGEYLDETGQAAPLLLDLPKAVHVLCTGASGLGKSTLLEAVALQLAGLQGVEMAAIDYGSGTFDGLVDRARWPLADTPALAIALLRELIAVCNKRKADFAKVGRIRSLEQYNATTGAALPFVACAIDETSALLDKPGTKEPLIELARMGRKYGVGLLMGGTDFKADTLPSEARGNCQARIAFWLEQGLSMSLLGSTAANRIKGDVGQIVVKRPGVAGVTEGRTPAVVEGDYRLIANRPPVEHVHLAVIDDRDLETAGSNDPSGPTAEQRAQIVELHRAGQSMRAIERALFGYTGGAAHDQVKAVIDATTTTMDQADQDLEGGLDTVPGSSSTLEDGWCEFCPATFPASDGRGFTTCTSCGVAVCDVCAPNGVCPDCQGLEADQ